MALVVCGTYRWPQPESAPGQRLLLSTASTPSGETGREGPRRGADLRAMTFRQCAEAYLAQHSSKWRNAAHARQWTASLATYAYPLLGDLPVDVIDTPLVLKVLEQQVEGDGRYPGGCCGWHAGKRPTAPAVASKVSSPGRRCANIELVTILPHGRSISARPCLTAREWLRSITRPFPLRRYPHSSRRYGRAP